MHKETDQRIRCDHHRDGVRADEFVSTSVLRGSTQSRCGTTTLADSQPRCANLCEKFGLALRRHDQWLAPATTPRDLGATAELQLLRQADPDSGQPLLVALDGHSLRREIWVCFDESSLDCGRRDVERLLQIGIFRRNFHHRARFAHGIEISARRKARTRPVLVPFIVNQTRRRH